MIVQKLKFEFKLKLKLCKNCDFRRLFFRVLNVGYVAYVKMSVKFCSTFVQMSQNFANVALFELFIAVNKLFLHFDG